MPQLIGVLMAAAMNFHMYFTVFNSSAHNYCPVLLIKRNAACKWTRYGPHRGSVPKAAILCGGFAVWVIYVVT